jgi:hypothetical protein
MASEKIISLDKPAPVVYVPCETEIDNSNGEEKLSKIESKLSEIEEREEKKKRKKKTLKRRVKAGAAVLERQL